MEINYFLKENRYLTEKDRRNLSIIDIIRKYGPISKPEISEKIGINIVTISNYLDEFLKKNFIIETQLDVSEGGRRPLLLDLNPKAVYTIGVGLNLLNVIGLLVDFKGNIIYKVQMDKPRPSAGEITECILEIIGKILQRSKEYIANIKGIGVGMAGLINKRDGSIRWPEKIDKHYNYISIDIPLRSLIQKEFGFPAIIDNDATCACFGEIWREKELEYKNLIYMFSGVGCGLMIEGDIYRGSQGYAGEVAIHNYREEELFNCEFGNSCFLKPWEYDLGMVEDLKRILSKDKKHTQQIMELVDNKIENIDLKTIFTASHMRNPLVEEVLSKAAKRLGIKIAFLVNLLNPDAVIIGGGLEEAGEFFLKRVIQTVKDWTFREINEDLKILYSHLKENASAFGAATLVMREVIINL
ncbi:MAG: ROK family transcriptional regulator [Candidatus Omnitrophica bacterium]|nr:ROK family transcriptional regulator [Candidatus Omnitrophota bacterium]